MAVAPRRESQLQARIWKAVVAQYPNAWIHHPVGSPFQTPGIPDLVMCLDGIFVAMEVKLAHPGESHNHAVLRATPQQRNQIRLINTAGGIAAVVTSVEEALDLLAAVRDRQRGLLTDRDPVDGEQ